MLSDFRYYSFNDVDSTRLYAKTVVKCNTFFFCLTIQRKIKHSHGVDHLKGKKQKQKQKTTTTTTTTCTNQAYNQIKKRKKKKKVLSLTFLALKSSEASISAVTAVVFH